VANFSGVTQPSGPPVTFLGRADPSDSKYFFASGLLDIYMIVLSKTEKLGLAMQLLNNLLYNL